MEGIRAVIEKVVVQGEQQPLGLFRARVVPAVFLMARILVLLRPPHVQTHAT